MSWHRVCRCDELVDNSGMEFLIGGRILAVFRSGEDFYAVDGMCAHQGGPLAQGELDKKYVTCPWHGWQYDISTGQNLLTGKKMLETFELQMRDGEIWVELG